MQVEHDWWKTFFHGAPLEMWTRAVPPAVTESEASFIEKTLGVSRGARLLDAPCGNGRLSIALAARDYRVTGIDLAQEYVDKARRDAAAAGVEADFRPGDVQQLPLVGEFDAAFSFGNSFGYFDDAGNLEMLRRLAAAVKPGGKVLLDTGFVLESLIPRLVERSWMQQDDTYVLWLRQYDPITSRLAVEYTFLKNGVPDARRVSYRLYAYRELLDLVRTAGLVPTASLGDLDQTPYTVSSPRLLLLAEKR